MSEEKDFYNNFIKSFSKKDDPILERIILFGGRKDKKTVIKEVDVKNILLALFCVGIEEYLTNNIHGKEGYIPIPLIGKIKITHKNTKFSTNRKNKHQMDFDYEFIPDKFLEKNLNDIYNSDMLDLQKLFLAQIHFEMEEKLFNKDNQG
jgi:hypothetical protein